MDVYMAGDADFGIPSTVNQLLRQSQVSQLHGMFLLQARRGK